jgi:hypothetical protein
MMMRRAKIVGVIMVALGGCQTTADQPAIVQRAQQPVPPDPFETWVKTNAAYIDELCRLPPGPDHATAWEQYSLAVSTDTERAAIAEKNNKRVVKCKAPEETSATAPMSDGMRLIAGYIWSSSIAGYTWSNSPARISGFTWSNKKRPKTNMA